MLMVCILGQVELIKISVAIMLADSGRIESIVVSAPPLVACQYSRAGRVDHYISGSVGQSRAGGVDHGICAASGCMAVLRGSAPWQRGGPSGGCLTAAATRLGSVLLNPLRWGLPLPPCCCLSVCLSEACSRLVGALEQPPREWAPSCSPSPSAAAAAVTAI